MDLRTNYLGMTLKTPLVASASPISKEIGGIKALEDKGASAVVLFSLFEEQIIMEQRELHYHTSHHYDSHAEALSYFPPPDTYRMGPEAYLEHIYQAKQSVDIPIIASLNGNTIGGWTEFARQIEQAGADALELNIYDIPTNPYLTGAQVEAGYVEIVKSIRAAINIPITVKLSPYFSSTANMAYQLASAGANGLVLFNRFYQPDIDLETFEVTPNVILSASQAMRLPLRWIAILYGRIDADFAASSGVHKGTDVIKLMMVGANVAMMTSALLKSGVGHMQRVREEMIRWMHEHDYESIEQMQGSMSQLKSPDPSGYERAQYIHALSSIPAEIFNK